MHCADILTVSNAIGALINAHAVSSEMIAETIYMGGRIDSRLNGFACEKMSVISEMSILFRR
jgi:hypothetical protein